MRCEGAVRPRIALALDQEPTRAAAPSHLTIKITRFKGTDRSSTERRRESCVGHRTFRELGARTHTQRPLRPSASAGEGRSSRGRHRDPAHSADRLALASVLAPSVPLDFVIESSDALGVTDHRRYPTRKPRRLKTASHDYHVADRSQYSAHDDHGLDHALVKMVSHGHRLRGSGRGRTLCALEHRPPPSGRPAKQRGQDRIHKTGTDVMHEASSASLERPSSTRIEAGGTTSTPVGRCVSSDGSEGCSSSSSRTFTPGGGTGLQLRPTARMAVCSASLLQGVTTASVTGNDLPTSGRCNK